MTLTGGPLDAGESTLNEVPVDGGYAIFDDPDDDRAHGRDERAAVARSYEALEFWNRQARR